MEKEMIVIKVDSFYSSEEGILLQKSNTQPSSPDNERRYYWCDKIGNIVVTNHRREEIERHSLLML